MPTHPHHQWQQRLPRAQTLSGRRRWRPGKLHADKAYDARHCRQYLCRREITGRVARRGIASSQRAEAAAAERCTTVAGTNATSAPWRAVLAWELLPATIALTVRSSAPHDAGGAVGLSLSSPIVGFVLFVLLFVVVPVALARWAQARQRSRGPLWRRDWEDDPGRGAEHAVNDAIGRGITGGHG